MESRLPARPRARTRELSLRRAFTLIELLSVLVIIGLLAGLAVPQLRGLTDRARVARAIGDLRVMTQALLVLDSLPASLAQVGFAGKLDPWGRPYVYYRFPPPVGNAPPAGTRKDRFLVPVNSRFDLYSLGANGQSNLPFTAAPSRDDVVVANDGGFYGLASKY